MSTKSDTPIVVTSETLSQLADALLKDIKSDHHVTKMGLLNTIKAFIETEEDVEEKTSKQTYEYLIEAIDLALSDQKNPDPDHVWDEIKDTILSLYSAPSEVDDDQIYRAWDYLQEIVDEIDTRKPEAFDYWVEVRMSFLKMADASFPNYQDGESIRSRIIFYARDAFAILFNTHSHFEEDRQVGISQKEYDLMTLRAAQMYLLSQHELPAGEDLNVALDALGKDIIESDSIEHLVILETVFDLTRSTSHERKSSMGI